MKKTMKLILLYLFALELMGLGIAIYLKAAIGVGSWDALDNNLTEFYGKSFGTWVFIVGILVIIISQLIYFNLKAIFSLLSNLILSLIINYWYYDIFTFTHIDLWLRLGMFFIGIVLLGSGIALLVLSTFPPTPPDVMMMSLMKRFRINFFKAKSLTEGIVFIVAVIVGSINNSPWNNLGLGTLLYLLLIGSIVEKSSTLWKKWFDI